MTHGQKERGNASRKNRRIILYYKNIIRLPEGIVNFFIITFRKNGKSVLLNESSGSLISFYTTHGFKNLFFTVNLN